MLLLFCTVSCLQATSLTARALACPTERHGGSKCVFCWSTIVTIKPDYLAICCSCCEWLAGDESDGEGSSVPDLSGMVALNTMC
jgi:hypothetical protein